MDHVPVGEYTVQATLRNQKSGAAGLVGLVYWYVDPANYREVALSPTGRAYLRQMHGGQMDTLAAVLPSVAPTMSLRVELTLAHDETSVSVNGVPVFIEAKFGDGGGQVGYSSYNTTARFDNISISSRGGSRPSPKTFPTEWPTASVRRKAPSSFRMEPWSTPPCTRPAWPSRR